MGNIHQNGLDREPEPWFYQSYFQFPSNDVGFLAGMGIVIRTSPDSVFLSSTLVRLVNSIDPNQVPYDIKTMEQGLADSLASRRFNAVWIGCFAAIALLLATIGVYGVMSYLVMLRTHEMGIRVALGAQPGQVLQLVFSEGLAMGCVGSALGWAGAYGLRQFLSALLVGVSTLDPAIYGGCTAALLVAVFAACYGPASRAARVDPLTSLRQD